ncbi:MAG TPA: DUF1697 domain-containing protein [Vicinamibacterales bacterium]|jgi:uncharacterized protein (DUF1697 family)
MTFVALLRGVNLAGRKMVAMADLRVLVERIGMRDVRTLLQSGNVVFSSRARTAAPLEKAFEAEAAKTFGFAVDVFVRSDKDLQAVIAANPFPREAARDPGRLLVMFLKAAPTPAAIIALEQAIPGRETLHVAGRHAYIYYPDGLGRSKLGTALIEKKLGTRGTMRNWNTVLRIAALHATQS